MRAGLVFEAYPHPLGSRRPHLEGTWRWFITDTLTGLLIADGEGQPTSAAAITYAQEVARDEWGWTP